jgi:tRNA (cmo5U34)-methyltransferase
MPELPDVAESFAAGRWEFTPEVAAVFDEHVRASVPFYDAIQDLVTEACDWLLPAGSLVADLGAATGTTVGRILDRHPERGVRAALYDDQPDMLAQATARLTQAVADGQARMHVQRVEDGPLQHDDADLTLALFLLQFLTPVNRFRTLENARKASAPGAALIIAEKVRIPDARWAEIGTDVSHDWKAAHGINAEAIRAKSRALRGVLVPQTIEETAGQITAAGWAPPEILFRWHQWVVLGAFTAP